jgi:hypothetical protein
MCKEGNASPEKNDKNPLGITVTIPDIIRGNPYVSENATPVLKAGIIQELALPSSIPLNKTYKITIQINPTCYKGEVEFSIM